MIFAKEDLFRQLEQLGAPRDSVVLVHSALRLVGPVEGDGEGFLDALVDYFTGEGGLLCIPTHTWHNLDKEITLDMTSEDTCLGALAALAIRDGRGIRSESPTHSVVVFGDREKALELIKEEPFARTPTAPETCYGKLYEMGGYVLLVGVSHNRNTYLHAVDEMLKIPNRMEDRTIPMTVRRADGSVIKRQISLFYTDYTEDISWRFPKYEIPFRYHGCIKDGWLGRAPVQLCDARKMQETVARIYQNSKGEDPLYGEEPIPPKWYC